MKNKHKYIEKNVNGFTLVETIAVIAIIAILFSVFTPKVAGYIKEAKKTKALEEVRQVVLAVDTYNIKASSAISTNDTFGKIKSTINGSSNENDLIDFTRIKSISNTTTYGRMKELLLGGYNFTLDDNGVIS